MNICSICQTHLPILPDHCRRCANFFTYVSAELNCGACLVNPPPFHATFALFPYEWPIVPLIKQLKFQHQLYHAQLFAELMLQKIPDWYLQTPLPDIILPVPLHPKRLRQRGFNQASEIAKPLARQLAIPLQQHWLKRTKYTNPQSELTAKARKKNLHHAFEATHAVKGLHIALIDDVITTGHTIRACAKSLQAKGARQIDVWCVARRG